MVVAFRLRIKSTKENSETLCTCRARGVIFKQSVEVIGFGCFVVRIPTSTSGCSIRYPLLETTTAGRTFVSTAPTSTPTTTELGFEPLNRSRPKILQILIRPRVGTVDFVIESERRQALGKGR